MNFLNDIIDFFTSDRIETEAASRLVSGKDISIAEWVVANSIYVNSDVSKAALRDLKVRAVFVDDSRQLSMKAILSVFNNDFDRNSHEGLIHAVNVLFEKEINADTAQVKAAFWSLAEDGVVIYEEDTRRVLLEGLHIGPTLDTALLKKYDTLMFSTKAGFVPFIIDKRTAELLREVIK
jgi:hypothetical protein